MEPRTYLENSNIISPLGWDTSENLHSVLQGRSGIRTSADRSLSHVDLPLALLDWDELEKRFIDFAGREAAGRFTRFEKAGILSIHEALISSVVDITDPQSILILATTKGNVELLAQAAGFEKDRLFLWKTAAVIADFFRMNSKPVIVSNACISGVAGILLARQEILNGRCKHAIVLGADLLSEFIVSGFQSFLSLSNQACKPFDVDREGLTLGEAAATVIITKKEGEVELVSGATSNDANHISGPSRTGEGLLLAIRNTLRGHGLPGAVSAHGTATAYNDEMESIAIGRAGLSKVGVNSLKGFYGHTLGAAGIVESIINIEALKQGKLPATRGFTSLGVSEAINVSDRTQILNADSLLKIASGFGGCNAAVLFKLK